MRKRILLTLTLFPLAFTTLFSQSSNLSDRLPSDVLMVFNFNLGTINSKIDLDKIKKLEIVEAGFSTLKRNMGKDSAAVKKMYADPNSYGINLNSSVTIGFRPYENEYGDLNTNSVFMINLSNVKKFEKFMKINFSEGTEYKDFLERKGVFSVFQSSEMAFVWNATTLYMIPKSYSNMETIDNEIDGILTISKTNSLTSNETFSNKSIISSDINFWLDYEKILNLSQKNGDLASKNILAINYDRLKGSKTEFGLNFDNGKIVVDVLSKVNEILKTDNQKTYSKKINPEFFNYLQEDSLLAVYSMAFDVQEMKKSIDANYKNALDTLEKTIQRAALKEIVDTNKVLVNYQKRLDSDTISWENRWPLQDSLQVALDSLINLEMKTVNKTIDKKLNEYGMTREDAWNLFNGDFMIAATGMYHVVDTISTMDYTENLDGETVYQEVKKTELSPRPLFLSMATINLVDKCANALKKLESQGLIKKKDDYYYLTVTQYDFYFKLNGNVLLLTNDINVVNKKYTQGKNIFGKTLASEFVSKSSNSPAYTFVDIEKILDKIPMKEEAEKKMMNPSKDTFKSIESTSTLLDDNNMSSTSYLLFKQNENAIHILFNLANEYYKLLSNNGY